LSAALSRGSPLLAALTRPTFPGLFSRLFSFLIPLLAA
jgi:hypothetical protein